MNFCFRLFLVFTTFLLVDSLFAQVKVTGNVVDKKGNSMSFLTIEALQNDSTYFAKTDLDGKYTFLLSPGEVQFTVNYEDTARLVRSETIPGTTDFQVETFRLNLVQLGEVGVQAQKDNGTIELQVIDFQKQTLNSVERYLIYTTAATSSNELTNNYNVRGGNYDENLVYVNGFLINRPFLTRSGQQEGLSFINTALVNKLYFSAGGFQSVYGDKLSSVLDIEYKHPDTLHASVSASLLGVEAHVEEGIGSRFRYLFGARYRSNGYLLNSLPTKGNYNPVFWDGQLVTEYDINERWKWSILGHISSNSYNFEPQTAETDFGTANEAYTFAIYFDGQEKTKFLTATGGTSLAYSGRKLSGTTYLTAFGTRENESFDIEGQYFINELETDPSKEEFGDSIATLGVGAFLNHARNKLKATIYSAYHDGIYSFNENSKLKFGAGISYDDFQDVLSEWRMIDSAGYSVPTLNSPDVDLFETIKGKLSLQNTKGFAYVQQHIDRKGKRVNKVVEKLVDIDSAGVSVQRIVRDTLKNVFSKWEFDVGTRAIYTSYNDEFMITPRASLKYIPIRHVFHNGQFERRVINYRVAAGVYYQPPFYREFRTFSGGLNPTVQSQKSAHFVVGTDYQFYLWKRQTPFKLSAEGYYKYLWDVNTYEIENVRTRYYADNNATGYATGFDVNLHGEFVPGIQSFFKLGVLSTKEDVLNDQYTNYYNAAGEKIIFGVSEDQVITDSVVVYPGFIRRPSDQRLNIGILFQDKMPNFEQFTVQLGLLFGSRLPYGPPDNSRYKDTLSLKSYFRVDIGLSYDFLQKRKERALKAQGNSPTKWNGKLQDCILSVEVFNLLGVNNVLSKQWIQDVEGKYYAIPNYLTQRRFNLKLIVRI